VAFSEIELFFRFANAYFYSIALVGAGGTCYLGGSSTATKCRRQ